jgi:hypothetical protein
MQLRQLSLAYQPEADRLLLRVTTAGDEAFAVWFTRRLCARAAAPLAQAVDRLGAASVLPPARRATATPEATSMLAGQARADALAATDFSQPFDETRARVKPLGEEPLLATRIEWTPAPDGRSLRLSLRDAKGRDLTMTLTTPMAIALRELMAAALRQAEWGVEAPLPAPAPMPAPNTFN